jgi:hypothetical protein
MSRRLRIVVAALFVGVTVGYVERGRWLPALAETLICTPGKAAADAIVIDNVQPNYRLFERARQLQDQGLATLVLVPIPSVQADGTPSQVYVGFMGVMCGIARVENCTPFPTEGREPISLHVAEGVARELYARGIRSILLVTSEFRSQRTATIYRSVLDPRGVRILCQPVPGTHTAHNWFTTTHGMQDFALQLGKLWYYRLFVRR